MSMKIRGGCVGRPLRRGRTFVLVWLNWPHVRTPLRGAKYIEATTWKTLSRSGSTQQYLGTLLAPIIANSRQVAQKGGCRPGEKRYILAQCCSPDGRMRLTGSN